MRDIISKMKMETQIEYSFKIIWKQHHMRKIGNDNVNLKKCSKLVLSVTGCYFFNSYISPVKLTSLLLFASMVVERIRR